MSMVEKTARAICIALGDFPDAELTYEGKPIGPAWKRYDDAARAALEALRVPSDEMKRAGLQTRNRGAGLLDTWDAMLTAALGETE